MKKMIRIAALALLFTVFSAIPLSAQKTEYKVGEFEGGLLTDGKLTEAFQKAADKFEEWMYKGLPSGYATKEDGYYLQTYADDKEEKAAIYVGDDYKSFVLRGPIYSQLESIGGLKATGRPVSDAYQVNGIWYQNFENGYATVGEDNGKAVFTKGVHVNEEGGAVPMTDTATDGSSGGTSGTDGTTDTDSSTTDSGNFISSASEMVSDAVGAVTGFASKWIWWIVGGVAVAAVAVPLILWLFNRK